MVSCSPEKSAGRNGCCLIQAKQSLLSWDEKRWRVLQPAIYLISVLPAIVCALVLRQLGSEVSYLSVFYIGLSVVLIQHAVNVFNDEIDWKKGADCEKKESWYHFHEGNTLVLKIHAWTSLILGTALGVSQVVFLDRLEVFWVALPLLLLGVFYNHSKWTLSYTDWGEWVTGLCYGPGVFGCMAYLLSPRASLVLILGSLAFSFLAVAVLLSHQPPQVLTDFAAGKRSFAVRYGAKKTYQVAKILTLLSLAILFFLFFQRLDPIVLGGALIVLIIALLFGLPQRLNPAQILRAASFEVLVLGIFSVWGNS